MPNGNKVSTWLIAIAAIVMALFTTVAGWSLHAGTTAKHEAHLVQGRFDEYTAGAKERENMVIYRLEQVEKTLAQVQTKLDELLNRE